MADPQSQAHWTEVANSKNIESRETEDHRILQHFERGQQVYECAKCGERQMSKSEFSDSCASESIEETDK